MKEMLVQSLGQEVTLEEEMATHCSILAWKIPLTEEPGGLQSMGLQRVGHDRVTEHTHTTSLHSDLLFCLPFARLRTLVVTLGLP